ncbi:MAG TPA: potassium channel family protein, partial [Ktedonobacterales bacterium]
DALWRLWSLVGRRVLGKRREGYLSLYGPLSLLLLLMSWAVTLIFAFGVVQWALGSNLHGGGRVSAISFGTDLYMSGTTFFTLGLGDVTPTTAWARFTTVFEAGVGFGFLALVIGYLPVLYQAFSRREVSVSLLDARAGSPPTAIAMLTRCCQDDSDGALLVILREWELWSAELLESHLSYPTLAYFRSQHEDQSWVASLTAVLDTCALVLSGIEVPSVRRQARLTFAIARHAAVDLAQILNAPYSETMAPKRLTKETWPDLRDHLRAQGLAFSGDPSAKQQFTHLRRMYEPYLQALSDHLLMPLPPWLPDEDKRDDWESEPSAIAEALPQL